MNNPTPLNELATLQVEEQTYLSERAVMGYAAAFPTPFCVFPPPHPAFGKTTEYDNAVVQSWILVNRSYFQILGCDFKGLLGTIKTNVKFHKEVGLT